jgi:uncharacterized protein (TIGR02466 family)
MIHKLFPTIVTQDSLKDQITEKEIEYLKSFNDMIKSHGNFISLEKRILDDQNLLSLKKKFEHKLKNYLDTVYEPSDEVEIYITQSWTNVTIPQGWHHQHNHPNSFLSAVFYIQVDEGDEITFYNDIYKQISFNSKNYHEYNSTEWTLKVNNFDLLIFPSSLSHGVRKTSENSVRISLAFNSFIRGKIGNEYASYGLSL